MVAFIGMSRRKVIAQHVNWRYVVLFVVILLPFFAPLGALRAVSPCLKNAVYYLQIASGCVAFLLGFFRSKVDAFSIISVLVLGIMFLATFLNADFGDGETYLLCYVDWGSVAVAALLVSFAHRAYMSELLVAALVITGVLSLCNTISVFVFPSGFDVGGAMPVNFYGNKNISIDIVLPSVLCSLLLDNMGGRRFSPRSAVLLVAGFAQCIISYSATSVVALCVFVLSCAAVQSKRARVFVNSVSVMVTCFAAEVLVIVRTQDLLASLMWGLLGKDATFSGRTHIWESAMSLMTRDRLFVGYGSATRFKLLSDGIVYPHTHNFFLQVFVTGGIAATILYGILVVLAARALFSVRCDYRAAVISAALGCLLLIGLMEPLMSMTWPLVLAIGYYWGSSSCGSLRAGRESLDGNC